MDFICYYNEIISIFNKELPESNRLPLEIIFKIIFKFKGLQNINYIRCFNEFKNEILYTKKNDVIDIDPNCKLNCSRTYMVCNKYTNCKKMAKLILKRIFIYRGINNIDKTIFNVKFNYKSIYYNQNTNTNRVNLRIINRKLKICNTRKCYLNLIKPFKLNTSLITKLLLTPRLNYLTFYEDYLENEISKELFINKNILINFNRTELIRFYLKNS